MKKNSCDIIIPVWNALDATVECVNSIIEHTHYPYRLIIIDNGSGKETRDWLLRLKDKPGLDLQLIRNEENLGFVKAVNQGMRASGAPYLCLMNNDTVAASGWLDEMAAVMETDPAIAIVNPSSNTFGQDPGGEPIEDYAMKLKRFTGEVQELYASRGFCMLIRRELINKIGFFDEAFNIGYFEETDFSFRAQRANFRIVRAKGAYVYHKENISFRELKDNKSIFAANEKLFFKRWGRPVRIGYFIDRTGSRERVEEIAEAMAKKGHQIFIFLKKGLDWPITLDHINIRRVDLDGLFFGLGSIYSAFKRKKKKKLEILITDNKFLGGILSNLKALHKSEVMVSPDADNLSRRVHEISQVS